MSDRPPNDAADDDALDRLRGICLAYPEAEETGGVGSPSFKVRAKIFAMRHPHEERWSVWFKAESGAQHALTTSEPSVYFAPPYVGQHGWIGVWLDTATDWDFLAQLIERSYRMTAPKRLIARLPEASDRE